MLMSIFSNLDQQIAQLAHPFHCRVSLLNEPLRPDSRTYQRVTQRTDGIMAQLASLALLELITERLDPAWQARRYITSPNWRIAFHDRRGFNVVHLGLLSLGVH
jgi:hypothetical protein